MVQQGTKSNVKRRPTDKQLKAIGDNIKQLMRERGMSQRDVADTTGIYQSNVSRYASGIVGMNVYTLLALCGTFGCTPNDLLDGAFEVPVKDEAADD